MLEEAFPALLCVQCQVAGYDTAENYLPPEEFPRDKPGGLA